MEATPKLADAIKLQHSGCLQEARTICRRILADDPASAPTLHVLGLLEYSLGSVKEGLAAMRRSLEVEPGNAECHSTLGGALGRLGQNDQSLEHLDIAVRLQPSNARAHFNRGITLEHLKKLGEAQVAYAKAAALKPDYYQAHAHLANLYQRAGFFSRAQNHCQKALEHKPGYLFAQRLLAGALSQLGNLEALLPCRKAIMETVPKSSVDHNNYLCALFYDARVSPQQYLAECRQWDQRHAAPPHAATFTNDPDPDRPLRIGYGSAHFSQHVVGRLLLPLLRNHDSSKFEVFCYSAVAKPDANTEKFKACGQWRDIRKKSDDAVAELIRADKIDILMETMGHFGGGQLPLFARRPAPIQVTHFGHFSTTGLAAMDYRFTDSLTDPPGLTDCFQSEKLIRLDPCAFCFLPEEQVPPPAAPPCISSRFVTFGCQNNLLKVSDPCVALWSRVLAAVPGSRLMLLIPGDEQSKNFTRERFKRFGTDANRLTLLDRSTHANYLKRFDEIDIALDPFPYNGDNTSCDGLWCGVPVLTLAGSWSIARRGISHLTALELTEWIAQTPEEFVAKAVQFAGDLERLKSLRSSLRQRMRQSPLCDAVGFARNVENAYRNMWRQWCQNRRP